MGADVEVLEARLGHAFSNRELLVRALTHKSRLHDPQAGAETAPADNEQLEFLGDAILGFLVSEALVGRHPGFPEGRLSKLKAHLVSASHLHRVAQGLELGEFLLLGRGEELSGGRAKKALLANALEALIAALYLDAGLEIARAFVTRRVVADFDPLEAGAATPVTDFKSALQELAQVLKLPQPRYVVVREQGPEHSKTFTVEVRLGSKHAYQADGPSKKAAGQRAAERALGELGS